MNCVKAGEAVVINASEMTRGRIACSRLRESGCVHEQLMWDG